jgi:hypothetical protein
VDTPVASKLTHAFLVAVALPLYQLHWAARYAGTYKTWPGKVLTFSMFLVPITAMTACWAMAWAVAVLLLKSTVCRWVC